MWNIVKENPGAVIFAVVVHILFAGILVFSLSDSSSKHAVNTEANIIKATVIDEGKIKKERALKKEIERKKRQEKKAAEQKKREIKRKAELKKKREAEKKKQLALKKKKLAEEKKRKQDAEKKKQQEKAEQKARETELQRQLAEDERIRKQQAEQERRRAASQKEVDKYQALIKQAISNKWRIPVSAKQGQECVLKLRLIPSGEVVGVEVLKSSGDGAFDRSVESAVYKASPLPLPPAEAGLFGEFREINVPFRLEKKN